MDERQQRGFIETEKVKTDNFCQKNSELVDSSLGLLSASILLAINQFNSLDRILGKIIALHYIQDQNRASIFANEIMNTGDITFDTKVKFVEKILKLKSGKLQKLRDCSKTRNNLLHSVYSLNPDFFKSDKNNFIITLAGRNGEEDSILLLKKFQEEYIESRKLIIEQIDKHNLPILKEELADV